MDGLRKLFTRQVMRQLNQRGLKYDDVLWETPSVRLAIQRLPQELADARLMRQRRAIDLDFKKKRLPEDFQEPGDHRYLQPYIEQVEGELDERATYSALYPKLNGVWSRHTAMPK
eukprot:GFYU01003327.1.p1 GENE.GFYU01003327.1~~GFYU01003327.1.p1  ORF type:complete len:115 (-),score=33.49 GFYU01003327.1:166-510(-)